MGSLQMGPPKDLVLKLRSEYDLKDFVETGTYYAKTALWAASHFDRVITVEYSRKIHEEVISRPEKPGNIRFLFGDSREVLKTVVPALPGPAFFWLDSHWCEGETHGQGEDCPLLQEISGIILSPHKHFIFIDDARLFMSPPPLPHQVDHWPSISEVIDALRKGADQPYIVIFNDVIISVPDRAKTFLAGYCQEANTVEENREAFPQPGFKTGCRQVLKGLKVLGNAAAGYLGRLKSGQSTSGAGR
jgi:hypothetical protein